MTGWIDGSTIKKKRKKEKKRWKGSPLAASVKPLVGARGGQEQDDGLSCRHAPLAISCHAKWRVSGCAHFTHRHTTAPWQTAAGLHCSQEEVELGSSRHRLGTSANSDAASLHSRWPGASFRGSTGTREVRRQDGGGCGIESPCAYFQYTTC